MTVDDAKIHLVLPLSLEKSCDLLLTLDKKNYKGFYRREVYKQLKVDFVPLDKQSIQFCIWVTGGFPEVEMVGVLRSMNETETTLDGESKRGWFNILLPLWPIILGIGLTLGMKSLGGLLFVFVGIGMGIYMARAYSAPRFTQEIERRISKNMKQFSQRN